MADYYTYVSAIVELPAEILDTFEKLAEYLEDENVELQVDLDAFDKNMLNAHERGWCCLHYERESDEKLWIRDFGGSAYIDELATCFHLALRFHNSDKSVVFDWANGCSKRRVDAFGGGAVFISKSGIDSITTYEWMRQKEREYGQAA